MGPTTTIFKILGTPFRARGVTFVNWMILWGFLSWIISRSHPERNLGQNVLIGFLATVMLLIADWGHAIAHVFSARYAGAPMDEIHVAAGMPRTLYLDDDVSPATHRIRALGGPIFSAIALLISLLLYFTVPDGTLTHELAGWSTLGHAFIFIGCLIPMPIVDGGTILKWTLVEHDHSPDRADMIVRRTNIVISIMVAIIGIVLLVLRMWLVGVILLGVSGVVLVAALGKIK